MPTSTSPLSQTEFEKVEYEGRLARPCARVEEPEPSLIRRDLGYGRRIKQWVIDRLARQRPIEVHKTQASGDVEIDLYHDPKPILAANRALRLRDGFDGYTPSRDLRWVARIPNGAVAKLIRMGINPYRKEGFEKLLAILDDPAYEQFRVSTGTLTRRAIRQFFVPRSRKIITRGPREL